MKSVTYIEAYVVQLRRVRRRDVRPLLASARTGRLDLQLAQDPIGAARQQAAGQLRAQHGGVRAARPATASRIISEASGRPTSPASVDRRSSASVA